MNIPFLRDDCEVAVIGAGPYGLAVAAHLRAANVAVRVFGDPMSFWRDNMPKGMRLRSPWIGSDIADPDKKFSLDAYVAQGALARQEQMPVEAFVRYGEWFQKSTIPDLDRRRVVRVQEASVGFSLILEDGEAVHARRVVLATGLANQDFRPAQFQGLPASIVSHTCDHADLGKWAGKRVAVVGRGQSACESAALLHEAGSEVDLISRGEVHWIGVAPHEAQERGWDRQVRDLLEAPSAVGPFPWNWLNELPGVERHLPTSMRSWISARSLRPACVRWVQPRFESVRVLANSQIASARAKGEQIEVRLNSGPQIYDHVLLATGYHIDIAKLGILAPTLLAKVAREDHSPILAAGFESTVPGLHFVGSSSLKSYGPLMRFIAGSGYTARNLTRTVLANRRQSAQNSTRVLQAQSEPTSAETVR